MIRYNNGIKGGEPIIIDPKYVMFAYTRCFDGHYYLEVQFVDKDLTIDFKTQALVDEAFNVLYESKLTGIPNETT